MVQFVHFLHGTPTELAGCMQRSGEAEEAVVRDVYFILYLCTTMFIHSVALLSFLFLFFRLRAECQLMSPQGRCFPGEHPQHWGCLFSYFRRI
jgi:hypothetical protein